MRSDHVVEAKTVPAHTSHRKEAEMKQYGLDILPRTCTYQFEEQGDFSSITTTVTAKSLGAISNIHIGQVQPGRHEALVLEKRHLAHLSFFTGLKKLCISMGHYYAAQESNKEDSWWMRRTVSERYYEAVFDYVAEDLPPLPIGALLEIRTSTNLDFNLRVEANARTTLRCWYDDPNGWRELLDVEESYDVYGMDLETGERVCYEAQTVLGSIRRTKASELEMGDRSWTLS
ncbi:hypothetical protein LTR08_006792 [Meristemomyces frigidus]|nr:hypothetical protein LTR08_006792 [Meristemomyces frigidus]